MHDWVLSTSRVMERNHEDMTVRKSIKQSYSPSIEVLSLMQDFRQMTNDCIRIGVANSVSSMKRLSMLAYKELKRYGGYLKDNLTSSAAETQSFSTFLGLHYNKLTPFNRLMLRISISLASLLLAVVTLEATDILPPQKGVGFWRLSDS